MKGVIHFFIKQSSFVESSENRTFGLVLVDNQMSKIQKIVRISDVVQNPNDLGNEPNLSCPKFERSDFGRLLYLCLHFSKVLEKGCRFVINNK